jgi:hypothetical protein
LFALISAHANEHAPSSCTWPTGSPGCKSMRSRSSAC